MTRNNSHINLSYRKFFKGTKTNNTLY